MSKKTDQASALAGILQAKRGKDSDAATSSAIMTPVEVETPPLPSPALPPTPSRIATVKVETASETRRRGKHSDPNFTQHSIYLRKSSHKDVKRRLEDLNLDKDVSDLVQELLDKWLKSGT